jgi:glycosyltransferase involved in cell wall biosynthesis
MENVRVHVYRNIRTHVHLLDLGLNLLGLPLRVAQFRAWMKRINPDVVHVHYINEAALCTTLVGFRPLVVTAYGSDVLINPRRSRLLRLLVRYVLLRADLVTCTGETVKGVLLSLGVAPSRVAIIYVGTDTERFHPRAGDSGLSENLALHNSPVVISLRRLDPVYDLGTLLNAVPLVLERCPTVKFIIAGSGSEEEKLQQMAVSIGVHESVRFVGYLSEEEVPRYLASADVYVSTALSDGGLSASTAEAMSCGLPVVITDVADNRRWVDEGISGFIVSPRDPQALAKRIIHLVEHREDGERVGVNARQVVVERNNWHKEMAKMEQIYQRMIQKATV